MRQMTRGVHLVERGVLKRDCWLSSQIIVRSGVERSGSEENTACKTEDSAEARRPRVHGG